MRDYRTEVNTKMIQTLIRSFVCLFRSALIALDKCPGVKPIRVGEEPPRILGKVIALANRYEVEDVCGVSQLCSGLKS